MEWINPVGGRADQESTDTQPKHRQHRIGLQNSRLQPSIDQLQR
ncbi:Uncharacterised protein [Vibrio cholerae]|nr:Uncharacterised protein [Vibrio cholerae]